SSRRSGRGACWRPDGARQRRPSVPARGALGAPLPSARAPAPADAAGRGRGRAAPAEAPARGGTRRVGCPATDRPHVPGARRRAAGLAGRPWRRARRRDRRARHGRRVRGARVARRRTRPAIVGVPRDRASPAAVSAPDPLETAAGVVLGVAPRRRLPASAGGPLAALERAVLPALRRSPCLVSFSGGRDSSAVLAV